MRHTTYERASLERRKNALVSLNGLLDLAFLQDQSKQAGILTDTDKAVEEGTVRLETEKAPKTRRKPYLIDVIDTIINESVREVLEVLAKEVGPRAATILDAGEIEILVESFLMQPGALFTPQAFESVSFEAKEYAEKTFGVETMGPPTRGKFDSVVMAVMKERNIELRTFPGAATRGMQLRDFIRAAEDLEGLRPGSSGITPAIRAVILNEEGHDTSLRDEAASFISELDIPALMDSAAQTRSSLVPESETYPRPQDLGTTTREFFGSLSQTDISEGNTLMPTALLKVEVPAAVTGRNESIRYAQTFKNKDFGSAGAGKIVDRALMLEGQKMFSKSQFINSIRTQEGVSEADQQKQYDAFKNSRDARIRDLLIHETTLSQMVAPEYAEALVSFAEEQATTFQEDFDNHVAAQRDAEAISDLESLDDRKTLENAVKAQLFDHLGLDADKVNEKQIHRLGQILEAGGEITAREANISLTASQQAEIAEETTESAAEFAETIGTPTQLNALAKKLVLKAGLDSEEYGFIDFDSLLKDDQIEILTFITMNPQDTPLPLAFVEEAHSRALADVAATEGKVAAKEEATRLDAITKANLASISRGELEFQLQGLGGSEEYQEFLREGGTLDQLEFQLQTAIRNLAPGVDVSKDIPSFIRDTLAEPEVAPPEAIEGRGSVFPGDIEMGTRRGLSAFDEALNAEERARRPLVSSMPSFETESQFRARITREAAQIDPSRIPSIPASAQRALVSAGISPMPTLSSAGRITQEELFGMDFGTDTEIAQAALDLSGGDPFLQEYLIKQAGTKSFDERFRSESQRRYQEAEDVFQARFAEVVDTSTGKVTPAPEQTTARGPTHAGLSKTDFLAQESGALTSQFDVQPSTVQRRQNEEERARVQAETEAERDREERERRSLRGSFSTFSRSA
jgi:hypothetical protein